MADVLDDTLIERAKDTVEFTELLLEARGQRGGNNRMKDIIYHDYYASSPGVDWNDLVSDGVTDARLTHLCDGWELWGVYEYDQEVTDERGRVIDVEARVVVRHCE